MKAGFYTRETNGKFAIYFSFRYNTKQLLISTGYYTYTKNNFDPKTLFSKKEPDYAIKNIRLKEIMSRVERVMIDYDLSTSGTDKRLEMLIREAVSCTHTEKRNQFKHIMTEFIGTKKTEGTKKVYTDTLRKVMAYDESCTIDDIDARWLGKFVDYCERTMSKNGYAIHLRNIRALFNYAIDEGYTKAYPFRKFKIAHEQTRKRSLTFEQMRFLRDYECDGIERKYIDIFLLMFYLCGINSVDLSNATASTNGRVEYRRAKTGKIYSVKIEPEADRIIKKYCGESHLIDIIEKYRNYQDFFHRQSIFYQKSSGSQSVHIGHDTQ